MDENTRNDSTAPPVLSAHPDALDLLKDFAALTRCLGDSASGGRWDDAFLFAAGLHQIVEDWLRDPWSASVVRKRARRHGLLGVAADRIGATGVRAATIRRRRSGIATWEEALRSLLLELGALIVDPDRVDRDVAARVDEVLRYSLDAALSREVMRIPSCFRSFDVRPDDIATLMQSFAERSPDRARPLAVLGVRTSGSYLAPLAAAVLRRLGYEDVIVRTIRPAELDDRRLSRDLRALAARGGSILVLDDPPNTGGSFRAVARWLAANGVPHGAVLSVAPLFTDAPASTLGDGVWLPWKDWSIHRRLDAASTHKALADLWRGERDVLSVEQLPNPFVTAQRRHARALFRVSVRDRDGVRTRLVYAKGAGYGYFANHALEVARRMGGHVAEVFGLVGGVLLREWLPDEMRAVGAVSSGQLAEGIAAYVVARERALSVPEDPSVRLFGRGTAWRRAAEILARAHGSAATVALPAAARVARQRLLAVKRPSIVDGTMESGRWFMRPDHAGLVKVTADHRAFASRELYCYDSPFDLAGAAAGGDDETASRLRDAYAGAGGSEVSDERWLLYTLVHLDAVRRDRPDLVQDTRRRMSLALQRYMSSTIFADTRVPTEGPLCALDVDGVLETGELAFPAIAPVAAFALRALARHGWRPLIVTGRSAEEVQSRCAAYPLTGGVAEYGAVLVDAASGRRTTSLSELQAADMSALRRRVAALSGVFVDPAFGSVVRAYRLDADRRGGISEADIARVTSGDTRIETVRGRSQTDLRPTGVDKAFGARALATALGASSDRPFGFAVGDSASDLPMFALAERAYVPSNAAELRSPSVRVAGAPYAAGFASAVTTEIGHEPGGCEVCAPPALSSEAALLLGVLAPQGQGRLGKLRGTAALMVRAARL